jgi:hypothetical protein
MNKSRKTVVADMTGRNPNVYYKIGYPSHTEERRWVDGVLARKKGLEF